MIMTWKDIQFLRCRPSSEGAPSAAGVTVGNEVQFGDRPATQGAFDQRRLELVAVIEGRVELPASQVRSSVLVHLNGANAEDGQPGRTLAHVDPSLIGHAPGRSNDAGALAAHATTGANNVRVGGRR